MVYLFRWCYEKKVRADQQQLQTLYDLTESFISSADPEAIQQRIAQTLPAVADATHGFVLILNPAKQQLEYVAYSDKPPAPAVSLSAMSGPVTCFRNRALTDVPDAEQCPFVDKDVVRRFGQKTLLYVPLMLEGECVGVIEIEDRRRKRIFSSEQVSRVEHVASLSALALRMNSQRSLRDQVHRKEKAGLVKDLLESIAGQLAEPLARIRSLAADEDLGSGGGALAAGVNKLEVQARQASDVLEQIAGLARLREGARDTADLNAIVQRIVETQRPQWEKNGLNADLRPARQELVVSGDPGQLQQVTANVIRRAEEMLISAGGRTLSISINALSASALITIAPGKSDTPQDNPAAAPRSAQPAPPPGLRLSVCKSLIEGMGGALRLNEEAARGFILEIEYPLAAAEWTPSKPSTVQLRRDESANRPPTALIIEENRKTQKELVHQISDHGYRAIPITTAEEGLDLCERMHFDWVFCAERIGRVSGLEMYERLRRRVSKFILLVDGDQALPSREMGVNSSLSRLPLPLTPSAVDQVLGSGVAEDPLPDEQ